MRKVFKNVNPTKFVDELVASNIVVVEAFYKEEEKVTEITFNDDVDISCVENIFKNHNPEVIPKPTLEEKIEQLEKENADLLKDSAIKDIRIETIENDMADLMKEIALGGV